MNDNVNKSGVQTAQVAMPDPEVVARPRRRTFNAAEKRRILALADKAAEGPPGETGALLRREGIFSSQLSTWRKQRAQGELAALQKKRGPKPHLDKKAAEELDRLRRENQRLSSKLKKAELIIDFQKKVSQMLGLSEGAS